MKKIAILGTSPSWKKAPFDDPSWEIWACNQFALGLERCECIFEIHRRWNLDDRKSPDKKYLEDLAKIERPRKVFSIVPIGGRANIVLDRKDLFKRYGAIWFSSSFGYMIARAIDEKAGEIGFWGIDMESREEYVVQQAGMLHLIDVARRGGIKINIPDYSLLNREPIPYPDRFETTLALFLEERAQRIKKLIDKDAWELECYQAMMLKLYGELEWREKRESPEDLEGTRKQYSELIRTVASFKSNVEKLKGALVVTQHYKRLFVWNALPPELGEETDAEIEDCGPI